jgi:hypothetical protein
MIIYADNTKTYKFYIDFAAKNDIAVSKVLSIICICSGHCIQNSRKP